MKVLIGIDPDVDKSGVATLLGTTLNMYNFTFPVLIETISNWNKFHDIHVVIEAGWLNKSNWHLPKPQTQYEKSQISKYLNIAAKIGEKTGRNHETGRKIVEMCEYHEIPFELVRPTEAKVDADLFKLITKHKGRTNQEQRDAAMLIWGRMT